MSYFTAKPSPVLSQYIKGYWELTNNGFSGEPYDYRIVPNGLPELSFYLGHRPVSRNNGFSLEANPIISGHKKQYHDILISDEFTMFSVLFYPQGLMAFFNIPVNEFFNRNFPLRFLFKNETDELEYKLCEAESFKEKVILIENFLIKRLRKNQKQYEYNRIEHSVNLITQTRGNIQIEKLASEACLSRKQFERVFAEHIGSTPKHFLRTIRFQNTVAQKALGIGKNLTELAYNCGYYDQSHMINDFKSLSGLTPTDYFKLCEPTSDYFLF